MFTIATPSPWGKEAGQPSRLGHPPPVAPREQRQAHRLGCLGSEEEEADTDLRIPGTFSVLVFVNCKLSHVRIK